MNRVAGEKPRKIQTSRSSWILLHLPASRRPSPVFSPKPLTSSSSRPTLRSEVLGGRKDTTPLQHLVKTVQKHQSAEAGSRRFTTPGSSFSRPAGAVGLERRDLRLDAAPPSQHCVAFAETQPIKSGEWEFSLATPRGVETRQEGGGLVIRHCHGGRQNQSRPAAPTTAKATTCLDQRPHLEKWAELPGFKKEVKA